MRIVGAAGLLACAVLLALSLMAMPATLGVSVAEWLPSTRFLQYQIPAFVALVVAIPFGPAFGAAVTRHVALKSLGVSLAAVSLSMLLAYAGGVKEALYEKHMLLQFGLFIVFFCPFTIAGNRLSRSLSRPSRIAGGSVAFVLIFALFTIAPFVATIVNADVAFTPEAALARAQRHLHDAKTDTDRFYALNDAAKQSFVAGNVDDARRFAEELLRMAGEHRHDWNYGNAIHDGNMVLGRIAVRENRIDDARRFLLEAGATPGSPQLDSFGPNMSLAKDLLDRGERDVVLRYFGLCRTFWDMGREQLDTWSADVKAGKSPDFGANLLY